MLNIIEYGVRLSDGTLARHLKENHHDESIHQPYIKKIHELADIYQDIHQDQAIRGVLSDSELHAKTRTMRLYRHLGGPVFSDRMKFSASSSYLRRNLADWAKRMESSSLLEAVAEDNEFQWSQASDL